MCERALTLPLTRCACLHERALPLIRCAEVIEWKKAYGKYKPLKTPAKCTGCHARIIMSAYHQLCEGCLRNKNACPKCLVIMEP